MSHTVGDRHFEVPSMPYGSSETSLFVSDPVSSWMKTSGSPDRHPVNLELQPLQFPHSARVVVRLTTQADTSDTIQTELSGGDLTTGTAIKLSSRWGAGRRVAPVGHMTPLQHIMNP